MEEPIETSPQEEASEVEIRENPTDDATPISNSLFKNDLNDKLFAIRMKINQSRKSNKEEVEQEYNRLIRKKPSKEELESEEAEGKSGRRKDKRKKESNDQAILNQSIEDAEWLAEKKRKKDEIAATYGLSAFTSDASYRAYEKRIAKLPMNTDENPSSDKGTSTLSLTHNPLDYGKVNTAVSKEALNRLRQDVIDREKQRKNFSRHRVGEESGDIDYINDKNKAFNKKLKNAFDKYTVEIRQSLERGTAL
jgi:pre-mRNA-splicing factor SYF2